MELVDLKCKHCGATMKVNSELDEIICNYCGTKILIDDEASNLKRVEDAKLDARKKNHEQDLKEYEDKQSLEEKAKEKKTKSRMFKWSIFLSIFTAMLIFDCFSKGQFICALISIVQTTLFVLTILICDDIIKGFFKKDYKVFFWSGILLIFIWGTFAS